MPPQDLQPVTITLSPAQVEEILRAAVHSGVPTVAMLVGERLAASLAADRADLLADDGAESDAAVPLEPKPRHAVSSWAEPPATEGGPRLSRSLLRGLSLLTRFGPDAPERGIVELAAELQMSASTAHRYAQTLVELGLLERSQRTRKYRLPQR